MVHDEAGDAAVTSSICFASGAVIVVVVDGGVLIMLEEEGVLASEGPAGAAPLASSKLVSSAHRDNW